MLEFLVLLRGEMGFVIKCRVLSMKYINAVCVGLWVFVLNAMEIVEC